MANINLSEISSLIKEQIKAYKEDIQTESYLNIANLYYKMKDYDHTLETLGKIKELQMESDSGLSVSL